MQITEKPGGDNTFVRFFEKMLDSLTDND